jgi:uncharacterized protein (TIGR03382 family)
MAHTLTRLACAAALTFSIGAQAALVTFDTPALIDIDNNTNVATYQESGFNLTGLAGTYLTLDGFGTAGSGGLVVVANSPLTLASPSGGLFSLLGIDYGLLDPQSSGSLTIEGLLSDNSLLTEMLALGDLANFQFQGWSGLKSVTFTGDADLVLDNINAVPEPGSGALAVLALSGLALVRRRRAD